jgi:hypothetical protein
MSYSDEDKHGNVKIVELHYHVPGDIGAIQYTALTNHGPSNRADSMPRSNPFSLQLPLSRKVK